MDHIHCERKIKVCFPFLVVRRVVFPPCLVVRRVSSHLIVTPLVDLWLALCWLGLVLTPLPCWCLVLAPPFEGGN